MTEHPDIFKLGITEPLRGERLVQSVDELIHLAREGNVTEIIQLLDVLIPGAEVRHEPPPEITQII